MVEIILSAGSIVNDKRSMSTTSTLITGQFMDDGSGNRNPAVTGFHFACTSIVLNRGADKFLARPTSRCLLFDGENISFDASLVI